MEELTVLAEIEYSRTLGVPTAFEPGIWRYCLYATGDILPFMDDTFNRVPVNVNNIIINQDEYRPLDELEDLRTLSENIGGWVNKGSIVYVRFPSYKPPCVFYSHKYGVLMGFTDGSPLLLGGLMYRPGLLSSPKVEQSADVLTYDKMKFISATISLDNTNGQFDKVGDLFGNEFNLLAGTINSGNGGQAHKPSRNDFTPIAQYYISNITATLNTATFHLKDKRERLSAKIPNRQYTREEYPDIDDNLIDKDIQEVYGRCFGVPGVCLEGKRIKAREGEPQDENGNLLQYRFRFSREITQVDRIQVKMTPGEIDQDGESKKVDGWTTVYQRVKPNSGSPDNWPGTYPRWKPGIIAGSGPEYWTNIIIGFTTLPLQYTASDTSLLDNGEITLHWKVAKQGGEYESHVNEVRMDGIFVNKTTPLDIITDIMELYSSVPFDERNYYKREGRDEYEITEELKPLNGHEIGIMFDKSISVYEAIEKLQGGCVLGFQFQVYENKFTARLDNPNRHELPAVSSLEIKNLDEVEIDWNADLYGTYTDIEYAYDYGEESGCRWIDKSKRDWILDLHRVDKEWSTHTLLADKDDAELKSNILLEDFEEMHPLIKNIKLHGPKWFNLRVFDIFYIGICISGEERDKYPHKLIMLIGQVGKERVISAWKDKIDEYVTMINDEKESPGRREFAGSVRCKVLRVEIDTKTGVTTIDVRVKKESGIWQR